MSGKVAQLIAPTLVLVTDKSIELIKVVFHVLLFVDGSNSVYPEGGLTVAVLENEEPVAGAGAFIPIVNVTVPFTGKLGIVPLKFVLLIL